MKVLSDLLQEKKEDLKKLQIEIATLEGAIRRANGACETAPLRKRAARSNVKNLVLGLLDEVGPVGLVAANAVELAEKRGERLERATVSSLLSRLKHDGVVTYNGSVYRLAKFGSDEAVPLRDRGEASVHPFPASKSVP